LAFSLTGCPDDTDMPDAPIGSDAGDAGRDGGRPGDGGMCTGTPCTTAGVTCEGNSLVTCALVAGCLVETTVNCAIDDQVCDATLATPACVDACADIPEADRCTTVDARVCTGETLEVCTMNTEGCLVLERTECDDAAGGECADPSGSMPMCVLPVDPCAGLTDACTTAGTSCDTDSLVTCAPNAFGCLVETTVDCTTATAGMCDDSGTVAVCTTTDVCPTACTAGAACNGPNLVTCAPDAFGCLVETTSDCTAAAFGFCDAAATVATCSTAATDPCMGVTECGTAPARTCTDDTLTVCAANAFGCFVAAPTDCTLAGNICDPTEPASCVPPSECGDGVIEGSETCDDMNTTAGDGCSDVCVLEAGWVCEGSPTVCVATCAPLAATRTLNCASATVSGNTTDGTTAISDYACQTYAYPSNEQVWAFTNEMATDVDVRIVATRGASTRDADLYVLEADSTVSCGEAACADSSTGTSGTETVDFSAAAGENFFVAYDIFDLPVATTDYTLTVTCTPRVCGDGTRAASEACDDGDTDNGDGCSSTCTIEPLFTCTGTMPSVCTGTCPNGTVQTAAGETCDDNNSTPGDGCSATCTTETGYVCSGAPSVCTMPAAPNAFCAGAVAVTANATFTGLDATMGGPRSASGTLCSGTSSALGYFYAVTAAPGQRVVVTETGTIDSVLNVMADCSATVCLAGTDTPENLTINNVTGTTPITRIVGVHRYSSSFSGTMGLTFAYTTVVCGDGAVISGSEACDDGNTAAGDGCSPTCTVETGYTCSGGPSNCVLLAANATCAGATAITANTALTNVPYLTGGPRTSTGSSCGGGAGNTTLYYAVTIPPATVVTVTTGGDVDRVLMTQADCAATTCSSQTDDVPETAVLSNGTTSPITRIVSVRPFFADEDGTESLDISFAYAAAPYAVAPITAACVTTGTWTSLTRSGTTDDATTTVAALPFTLTYFGSAVTHFTTSTNGFAQLWSSSTASPLAAFTNASMPNSTTPNGVVAAFWDDLYLGTAFDIRTQTTGTPGSQVFVIDWNDALAGSGGSPITFQAHFVQATNAIELHYCAIGTGTRASGDSATIGVENLTGTAAVQRSFNTAATVSTGSGFRFTPNP
jgi:cysteine-rich repeat protein